jgi:hypothetical protein
MKILILLVIFSGFIARPDNTGKWSFADEKKNAVYVTPAENGNFYITKEAQQQAQKDSIQQFKNETNKKIVNNEKIISDIKLQTAKAGKTTKTEYQKLAAGLEKKNREMKKKLNEFDEKEKRNGRSSMGTSIVIWMISINR